MDMEKLSDLLNEEQEVKDAPDATELSSVRGEVEFSNVTFGYISERTILKNISFSVPAGKTVALVGPSGSGKSTIIRLLFRFYDINDGCISVDGQNIKTAGFVTSDDWSSSTRHYSIQQHNQMQHSVWKVGSDRGGGDFSSSCR